MPWLLTTVPEPPWSLVQRPIQSSVLHPHSRLLDPRWAAAVGGYVADTVKLQERLHKGDKRGGKEDADGPGKRTPAKDGKAKARAKGEAEPPPKK